MSKVLRFPHTRPIENGITYVVPFDDGVGHYSTWSLYRQARDADEPKLIESFDTLGRAVFEGRQIARRNRDRFVIDEGVK